jgi:hypothetical protein
VEPRLRDCSAAAERSQTCHAVKVNTSLKGSRGAAGLWRAGNFPMDVKHLRSVPRLGRRQCHALSRGIVSRRDHRVRCSAFLSLSFRIREQQTVTIPPKCKQTAETT